MFCVLWLPSVEKRIWLTFASEIFCLKKFIKTLVARWRTDVECEVGIEWTKCSVLQKKKFDVSIEVWSVKCMWVMGSENRPYYVGEMCFLVIMIIISTLWWMAVHTKSYLNSSSLSSKPYSNYIGVSYVNFVSPFQYLGSNPWIGCNSYLN